MPLTPEAVEHASRSGLKQLSERLSLSRKQSNDEVMECLQFGICTVPIRNLH